MSTLTGRSVRPHYLSWHSVVPAPRTILRGVQKLPPARHERARLRSDDRGAGAGTVTVRLPPPGRAIAPARPGRVRVTVRSTPEPLLGARQQRLLLHTKLNI